MDKRTEESMTFSRLKSWLNARDLHSEATSKCGCLVSTISNGVKPKTFDRGGGQILRTEQSPFQQTIEKSS